MMPETISKDDNYEDENGIARYQRSKVLKQVRDQRNDAPVLAIRK